MTQHSDPFAIHRSVVQLQCTRCGAEANASCSCGVAYEVIAREKEAHRQRSKTYRDKKRQENQSSRDVTLDEIMPAEAEAATKPRENPMNRPQRPIYIPEPGETDLIDFIIEHFMRLSLQAQARCTVRLYEIIQGKAS